MTFEEWYGNVGISLPCWRDKGSLARAWDAGAEEEREKLRKELVELERYRSFVKWDGNPIAHTDTVWIEPGRSVYIVSQPNDQG